jgi:hypothetical protein
MMSGVPVFRHPLPQAKTWRASPQRSKSTQEAVSCKAVGAGCRSLRTTENRRGRCGDTSRRGSVSVGSSSSSQPLLPLLQRAGPARPAAPSSLRIAGRTSWSTSRRACPLDVRGAREGGREDGQDAPSRPDPIPGPPSVKEDEQSPQHARPTAEWARYDTPTQRAPVHGCLYHSVGGWTVGKGEGGVEGSAGGQWRRRSC